VYACRRLGVAVRLVKHVSDDADDSATDWPARYVRWECDLLAAVGFGLDLGRCAVTGVTTDLAYVSPRTGRAVSRAAGLPYHHKLLLLPEFLWCKEPAGRHQIALARFAPWLHADGCKERRSVETSSHC